MTSFTWINTKTNFEGTTIFRKFVQNNWPIIFSYVLGLKLGDIMPITMSSIWLLWIYFDYSPSSDDPHVSILGLSKHIPAPFPQIISRRNIQQLYQFCIRVCIYVYKYIYIYSVPNSNRLLHSVQWFITIFGLKVAETNQPSFLHFVKTESTQHIFCFQSME